MVDLQSSLIPEPDGDALASAFSAARGGALTIEEAYGVRKAAEHHGVLPLLAQAALVCDPCGDQGARAFFAGRLQAAAARDLFQQIATRRAIEALAAAGIEALVLKGEHVARTLYPAPQLRPHLDTDLLLARESRDSARAVLEGQGYLLLPHVRGDAILAQMQFSLTDASGAFHALDLHWHALNPHPFRSAIDFEAALGRAVPIPALGVAAKGLCLRDALLHAVAHLAVHHPGDVRLIWIADVDLIARSLPEDEWQPFIAAATRANACAFAQAGLAAAKRFFATPVPDEVCGTLAAGAEREAIACEYLMPRSRTERLLAELRALPRWRDRAATVYQHLVPDAAYMRQRYSTGGVGLAWAYVRRAAGGARKWLERPATVARR